MFQLILHPTAQKEYEEAMIWYEQQKPGLGKRFEIAVDAIIKKIQTNPELFGYSRKPFREASVILFPYAIVFKINKSNQTVYIAAVYHTSRNPKKKYRN